MSDSELIKLAVKAREFSYSPYSKFKVGCALLCKNGKVYTGCNIENSSYSLTNCAERTAFFKAISEGTTEFIAIAIVGGKDNKDILKPCYPCGSCRQVMAEFCNSDFKIIIQDSNLIKSYTLLELLPNTFLLTNN